MGFYLPIYHCDAFPFFFRNNRAEIKKKYSKQVFQYDIVEEIPQISALIAFKILLAHSGKKCHIFVHFKIPIWA